MTTPAPPNADSRRQVVPMVGGALVIGAVALALWTQTATDTSPEPPPQSWQSPERRQARSGPPRHPGAVKDEAIVHSGPEYASDLWTFLPDHHEQRVLEEESFKRAGGIDSPGVDTPAAAWQALGERWGSIFARELRSQLAETLPGGDDGIDRLGCATRRCLVELQFPDFAVALAHVGPLRQWAASLPCRTYSDGPEESESPGLPPRQQIWLLCGGK